MAELLLELLSEEIPARMQARAADDLKRLMTERLRAAGLDYAEARAFVTPRRLALVVEGLPRRQPDVIEERRGPRVDAPQKAIEGFLRGSGLASVEEAELRETDRGRFYFAVRKAKGQASAKVLPGLIHEVVAAVSWPKSMRWGENRFAWVRPLHAILAVFDGRRLRGGLGLGLGDATLADRGSLHTGPASDAVRFVPDETDAADRGADVIRYANSTVGHRWLAPKPFKVKDFADYEAKLRAAKVILDPAARRGEIARQAKRRAGRSKLTLCDDPALLDELAGLVEWPVVLLGRIDEDYMDLPPEVLTTSMRAHQKYLALTDGAGKPASRFLVVANTEASDRGRTVVAGNERVLRARLADARFFWDQDRKVPLGSRTPKLGEIVFHAKLGTLDEKIDRVQALAVELAGHVAGADKDRVRSAARLAKADLVTGMVGEFPELQGVMGRYYALHDGEHVEVANAIAEHYAPQGPNDACPGAPVSVALALADKIDTLVGFWAIGEKPTGSKDPFALRRAALGVIRLILENEVRVSLRPVFELSLALYPPPLHELPGKKPDGGRSVWTDDLLDFFAERLKVALRDRGVRHDLISAVFSLGGEDDLVRLLARVRALERFLASDDGANLLVAYQRAANIVRIEEKRDGVRYRGEDLDMARLREAEEKTLCDRILGAESDAKKAIAAEDFTGAMSALAKLRRPIDTFFDRVTVNVEDRDLRANRLRLLARVGTTLDRVADFSKIEG